MLSRVIAVLFCLLAGKLVAQVVQIRDLTYNNVLFRINTDGNFFEDSPGKQAFYRVPASKTVSTLYAANWWFGATGPTGDTATLIGTYMLNGQETMIGPSSTSYDPGYFNKYYRTWPMTLDKINYHRLHYQDFGYILDSAIAEWPAHGREGIDTGPFAPFADVNNNQVYDPENGDYPHIPGDMAVFFFKNSTNPQAANTTGGKKLKLALSGFLYAFNAFSGPLSQSVFIRTNVVNRDTVILDNFFAGMWMDGDLGGSGDDFGGSIPEKNAVYTYNADNEDTGDPDVAFGTNPPVQGFVWLNTSLSSSSIYSVAEMSEPFTGFAPYYHLLSGKTGQGMDKFSGLYDYPDHPSNPTGNSEFRFQNDPGDRRMLASTRIGKLLPGEAFCLDGVLITAQGGNNLENVTALDAHIMQVKQYYQDFLGAGCQYYNTAMSENNSIKMLDLYPNPVKDYLNLVVENDRVDRVLIYDVFGRSVLNATYSNLLFVGGLLPGTYFLSVQLKNGEKAIGKTIVKQ